MGPGDQSVAGTRSNLPSSPAASGTQRAAVDVELFSRFAHHAKQFRNQWNVCVCAVNGWSGASGVVVGGLTRNASGVE